MTVQPDYIDKIQAQWAQIQPELSTSSTGIVGRITRLAQVIQTRSDRVLESCGITRSEFDILALLTRTGRPMTPGEISTQLLCSGAGTTKRIKKLVSAGMITRDTNPEDGRGALISLTDKAQATTIPILRTLLESENDLIEPLPTEHRDALTANLRILLGSVDSVAYK